MSLRHLLNVTWICMRRLIETNERAAGVRTGSVGQWLHCGSQKAQSELDGNLRAGAKDALRSRRHPPGGYYRAQQKRPGEF